MATISKATPKRGGRAAGRADRPDPLSPASQAWWTIYQLVLSGEGRTRLQEASRDVGLPINVVKALLLLDRDHPAAMRDLAAHFNVDPSYCTTLVDTLEEHGVARREQHATDRRIKTVVLTTAGRKMATTVKSLLSEPPAAIQSLSAAEQRQLRDLLQKVAVAEGLCSAAAVEPAGRAEGADAAARHATG